MMHTVSVSKEQHAHWKTATFLIRHYLYYAVAQCTQGGDRTASFSPLGRATQCQIKKFLKMGKRYGMGNVLILGVKTQFCKEYN